MDLRSYLCKFSTQNRSEHFQVSGSTYVLTSMLSQHRFQTKRSAGLRMGLRWAVKLNNFLAKDSLSIMHC